MALMEKAEAFAVKAALEYLDRNPEKNLPKLMDWFDKFDRKGTLLEAYCSPLFMGYHDNQPWNGNMLRPCPVLDNPGRLTEIVEKSGAKSTDYQNPESAKELSDKCVETAAKWEPVAERLWQASKKCAACKRCVSEEK